MKIKDSIYYSGCLPIGFLLGWLGIPLFDDKIIGFVVLILALLPIMVIWNFIVYDIFD
jgi:hypothetical protein